MKRRSRKLRGSPPLALICLLAVCGTVMLGSTAAFAFRILQSFEAWPGGTVGYFINPNFPDETLAGSPDRQIEVLRAAARSWTDQTRADFAFRYNGTTERERVNLNDRRTPNAVFWTATDGGDALAATMIGPRRDGTGLAFDIVFFGQGFNRPNVWRGVGEPQGVELDILGVATHEFGHALGLDHSSEVDATMTAAIVGRGLPLRTLAEDDRLGVETIYTPAQGTPEPAVRLLSLTPTSGPTRGDNEVVLTGVNFSFNAETTLVIGGFSVSQARWHVEAPDRLRITAMPPSAAGVVDVVLSNSLGTSQLTAAYSYVGEAFVRGEINGDGELGIADASFALSFMFLGGPAPVPCSDAADVDDDGELEVNDPIYLLNFLFQAGPPPPPPHPESGLDPSVDRLDC